MGGILRRLSGFLGLGPDNETIDARQGGEGRNAGKGREGEEDGRDGVEEVRVQVAETLGHDEVTVLFSLCCRVFASASLASCLLLVVGVEEGGLGRVACKRAVLRARDGIPGASQQWYLCGILLRPHTRANLIAATPCI